MDPRITLAVVYALGSALGFALSTSLQHRVAGAAPGHGLSAVLRFVLSRKVWLLGAAIGFVALILHALALNNGAIALVQPIMVSGVVLAVLFRAALDRTVPSRRELIGVLLTTAALACFVVVADPTVAADSEESAALIVWVIGVLWVGALVVLANRQTQPRRASFLLGAASGVCFGLTAGLLKLLSNDFGADGILGVLTTWHLVAQVATGIAGVAINQRAYHLAPLAVSMPILNVVDVLVALAFGVLVFGEIPTRNPIGVAVLAVCLGLMGLGIVCSPTLTPMRLHQLAPCRLGDRQSRHELVAGHVPRCRFGGGGRHPRRHLGCLQGCAVRGLPMAPVLAQRDRGGADRRGGRGRVCSRPRY
ncbi:MAG: DMT family transporter [Nocardioides sp.]